MSRELTNFAMSRAHLPASEIVEIINDMDDALRIGENHGLRAIRDDLEWIVKNKRSDS